MRADLERMVIGTSGVETSRIGLGTWAIGGWMWGGADPRKSIAAIRAAVERGVTLIDTAPAYGFGDAEQIVGRALRGGLRHKAQIATKAGLAWRNGRLFRDSRPERIRNDLYQVRWPDPRDRRQQLLRGADGGLAPRRSTRCSRPTRRALSSPCSAAVRYAAGS